MHKTFSLIAHDSHFFLVIINVILGWFLFRKLSKPHKILFYLFVFSMICWIGQVTIPGRDKNIIGSVFVIGQFFILIWYYLSIRNERLTRIIAWLSILAFLLLIPHLFDAFINKSPATYLGLVTSIMILVYSINYFFYLFISHKERLSSYSLFWSIAALFIYGSGLLLYKIISPSIYDGDNLNNQYLILGLFNAIASIRALMIIYVYYLSSKKAV